jgi:hypothetical protein
VAKTVYASDTPAPVMNRLVPFSRNPPSSVAAYLVSMLIASLPAPGSVRQYDMRWRPSAIPPNSSRFCSSEPASITGIAPSRATSGVSVVPADTRDSSSVITANVREPPPPPPNSSG